MKKRKSTKGILIDVCIMLVCLLVVSTSLASGVFAKYITKAGSPSQNARVAVFNVDATADNTNLEIGSTQSSQSFNLTVRSSSETVVNYTVTLQFENSVASVISSAVLGTGDNAADGVLSADGKTFTWEDFGTFAPGTYVSTLPLTVTIDRTAIVSEETDLNFTAFVTFTQVD